MKRVCVTLLILVMVANMFVFTTYAEEKSGVCGENLTWILDNDGTLTISGSGDMYNFDIPGLDSPIIDGYYISPWNYRELVKKVVIEDGVTSIGCNAFSYLNRISEVVLPDSLKSIGDYAFEWCSALLDIKIPSGVDTFGCRVFYGTPFLQKEFDLNNGGLYINDILVEADTSTKGDFVIKEGTKSISQYAFYWASRDIDTLVIPESIETISASAINSIMRLKQIILDENNPHYALEDGVLFNKDKTELIYCTVCKEGEYTIPEGVKIIAPEAFSYSDLNSIIISDSVEEIGVYAFLASAIESITISNRVNEIPDGTFDGCWQLTDVYYDGTETEWKNVIVGEENDELLNANIHYLRIEEADETVETEKPTAAEDLTESISSDSSVKEETAQVSVDKPENENKQTGDPIGTLYLISTVVLVTGTVAFVIFVATKKRQKKLTED